MQAHPAEQRFQKGLERARAERYDDALPFFKAAVDLQRKLGGDGQARYRSYYGLCLAKTGGNLGEALECCRSASRLEGYRPDICWNLGRVLILARRREEAYQAFRWGLRMEPKHPGILRDLAQMGYRRGPVLPFLGRRNPLNVLLGRIRAAALISVRVAALDRSH